MVLLMHHVYLQSVLADTTNPYLDEATDITTRLLEKYPGGELVLLYEAKLLRMKCDWAATADRYETVIKLQKPDSGVHLLQLCYFELSWCHIQAAEWTKVIEMNEKLLTASDWSKPCYLYTIALAYSSLQDAAKAKEYFVKVLSYPYRKVSGSLIPMDEYVLRKAKRYAAGDAATLVLPDLEIFYLWNGFNCLPEATAHRFLERVLAWQQENPSPTPEAGALVSLLLAALYVRLNRVPEAEPLFESVIKLESATKSEAWIVPYAKFDHALVLHNVEGGTKRVKEIITAVLDHSRDHDLQDRLHTRAKLMLTQLQPPKA